MNLDDRNHIEELVKEVLNKHEEDRNDKHPNFFNKVTQAILIAGIIGLFVQFQDVKEATQISKAERTNFKEDIKELKEEVRSLRLIIYSVNNNNYESAERSRQ